MMMQTTEISKTPMQLSMDQLGKQLSIVSVQETLSIAGGILTVFVVWSNRFYHLRWIVSRKDLAHYVYNRR